MVAVCGVLFVEFLYHVDQPGVDALTYTCQAIQFFWPSFSGQAPQFKGFLEDRRQVVSFLLGKLGAVPQEVCMCAVTVLGFPQTNVAVIFRSFRSFGSCYWHWLVDHGEVIVSDGGRGRCCM